MNLSIFFEPLSEAFFGNSNDPKTIGAYTDSFVHQFPDWEEADIAIIGVNEYRGSETPELQADAAIAIRRKLYELKKGTGRCKIADLGNLRPGITLEDTYLRLKEIVEALLLENTLPLLIGGSHDLDFGQYLAYENLHKPVNMVMIDSHIDMEEDHELPLSRRHLHQILMHEPHYLFNFSQVAYQSYFTEPEVLATLEKIHFEMHRIGEVHRDIQQMEPVLRHADLISFDVSAVKFQDLPGYEPANPFGLSGEQACQLCWYAGISDQLSSFGVYGYKPEQDSHSLGAATIATMLWYFIEGYYHRKNETDFSSNKFTRYAIGFHNNPHKMVFYKSKVSDKWWLEVENLSAEGEQKTCIVPCTYDDYLTASNGEVPNRWILTQQRMF